MVGLRKERNRLRAELEQVGDISVQAVASTKMVGRLLELAGNFQELWAVATLAEKKEFLSFLSETISINPRRKKATIRLSANYLELKKIATGVADDSFLVKRRGDPNRSTRIDSHPGIVISLKRWKPRCHTISDDLAPFLPSRKAA